MLWCRAALKRAVSLSSLVRSPVQVNREAPRPGQTGSFVKAPMDTSR